MASVEIALVCGLKVRVGCQDRLCVNSDADETLALMGKQICEGKCYLTTVKKKQLYVSSLLCNF